MKPNGKRLKESNVAAQLLAGVAIEAQRLQAERDEAIEVLKGLMASYGAIDGRNGNSGECWDKARAFLCRLGLWTKDRGFINGDHG